MKKIGRRKSIILLLIISPVLFLFFSHRLLEVPTGLTIDEATLGYNGVLLARTGYDQNNHFLPIFTLSRDKIDWHQPVTQYFIVILFKLFGPSVYNLRLSSVLIVMLGFFFILYLSRKILGSFGAIFASIVYILTPAIMIHAHLATENIMPLLFAVLWLFFIKQYLDKKEFKQLIFGGIALGIGFYSYKGMRLIVPAWCLLTAVYLYFSVKKQSGESAFRPVLYFCLGVAPFLAITPVLEMFYHGAVFDYKRPEFSSVYELIYPYLSSFDLSFLFIKGDSLLYHSTQKHGVFILSFLPLFLLGCQQALIKKKYWIFVLASFFTAPLFYGLVNSVYRASRLLVIVPSFCLITALGAESLLHLKKTGRCLLLIIGTLVLINYFDFINYYWYEYPKFSENVFGHLERYRSFEKLAELSEQYKLIPYVADNIDNDESSQFFESIYFVKPVTRIGSDYTPPEESILLTWRENLEGMKRLDVDLKYYYLQVSD